VVRFTLRQFYLRGKNHGYPSERRLSGYQNRSGHGLERRETPAGNRTQMIQITASHKGKVIPVLNDVIKHYAMKAYRRMKV
jgi:hypothetical protein